jgi:DNA-binding response OmpR family regulator
MDQVTASLDVTSIRNPVLEAKRALPRRGAILVVEDRDDVRQGLAQLLEMHGFVVSDAADGERALGHLRSDPDTFALVLLDLMLPGAISGHSVRACQLADTRLAAIPTIIVSACEPDSRGHAQLRPAAWLEKPFRFDALLGMVRKYVKPEGDDLNLD